MPRILAAVATKPKSSLQLRELMLAEPEDNEILVKTAATGICHTDLLLRDGIFGPKLMVQGVVIAVAAISAGMKRN